MDSIRPLPIDRAYVSGCVLQPLCGGHSIDIDNLTKLTVLDLSSSGLIGRIPPSIVAYTRLWSLYLQGNNLTSGIVSLGGLVNFQTLNLGDNNFGGPFPQELGTLSSLVNLDLSNNFLTGIISTLPNLTKLGQLRVDNNFFIDFKGEWFVGANASLWQLSVSLNHLGGTISSSISSLMNLHALNLSCNQLLGNIPLEFPLEMQHDLSLDLSQNELTRNIHATLLQMYNPSKFADFNFSYNLLVGGIPLFGPNSSTFIVLDLSHNNLSGPIP